MPGTCLVETAYFAAGGFHYSACRVCSGRGAPLRAAVVPRGPVASRHPGQRGGRGHPGAPRAASVCAADRAGAKCQLRLYVSGSGSSRGRRRGRRREGEGVPRGRRARDSRACQGDFSRHPREGRRAREDSSLRDRPCLAWPPHARPRHPGPRRLTKTRCPRSTTRRWMISKLALPTWSAGCATAADALGPGCAPAL